MESSAKLLEDSLLVIWNDRDPEKRLRAMEEVYATDITFYEANEGPAIVGYEAINNLISKLQEQWPPDFVFVLSRPSHVNHQVQHITWTLGVPGQAPVASGMDVAIVENHQIKSLHLLLDAPGN
jgi:hypothetical protein